MDNHGRVFYIDHKNHTTTWQKPGAGGGGRSTGGTSPGGAGMATNKAFYFTLFNFLILNKSLVGFQCDQIVAETQNRDVLGV